MKARALTNFGASSRICHNYHGTIVPPCGECDFFLGGGHMIRTVTGTATTFPSLKIRVLHEKVNIKYKIKSRPHPNEFSYFASMEKRSVGMTGDKIEGRRWCLHSDEGILRRVGRHLLGLCETGSNSPCFQATPGECQRCSMNTHTNLFLGYKYTRI